MPLFYDTYPPTADSVRLDPRFKPGNDTDGDMVTYLVGEEDAYLFATDIKRDENGDIDLGEVRKGLTHAAEVLTDDVTRSTYLRGVEHFISHQLRHRDCS